MRITSSLCRLAAVLLAIIACALVATAGSEAATAEGVSCLSTAFCLVAGTFQTSEGSRPLALRWNGSAWTAEEALLPTPGGGFEASSCYSVTTCDAVGTNGGHWIGAAWDGTKWTEQAFPEPATANSHLKEIYGMSCNGPGECMAVGYGSEGEGYSVQEKPLAAALLTPGGWVIESPPYPTGGWARVALVGVSCVSGPVCVAVGNTHPEGEEVKTLAEIYK